MTDSHGVAASPPATLLLAPLGLAVLGLAWSEAAFVFALPTGPGGMITGFAAGLLLLFAGMVAAPALRHWRGPSTHPAPRERTLALASAGVTAIILSGAALPRAPGLSLVLWLAGIACLAAAGGITAARIIARQRNPLTLRPAVLLIPCGLMAAPVAGSAHDLYLISIALYVLGLLSAVGLYGLALAHAISGWLLPPAAPIERAARTVTPMFAFLGYQGINGGFADPTAFALAILVLPVLGEIVSAVRAARRTPAHPRAWLSVAAIAGAALVLLVLYEWVGGVVLATLGTLTLSAATFAGLYALYFCLSAAARGTARHPYRQPPPDEP